MPNLGARCATCLFLFCLTSPACLLGQATSGSGPFESGTISGLGARNIGSATMSGRVSALAAVKDKGRLTIYIGAASGGVWKSVNGGTTYKPVFDKQPVQSIGAIAVDPSAPKTIWVGTGESWTRNSVSVGDGIYKSTDAGENWTNMGLKDSERITNILVDPRDGNTVYACVPGKLWSDSEERGLFKTTDGGKSWAKILKGFNLSTGCSMVSMSSRDAKTLYAGLWDFRRQGWTFRSGGDSPTAPSGSGLFNPADGGSSWTEISANPGLPAKPWGRVAVASAPSNPDVVYALIESTHSGLFRSEDGGKTWQPRDASQMMVWRPFYFGNLIVDPKNENKLYKPGGGLIMSEDGGRSFTSISGSAHGDFHDVWIDPDNTDRVIVGDDGGVWYSYDGANTWWKANNLPISQFYHASVDLDNPYHVYQEAVRGGVGAGGCGYPGGVAANHLEEGARRRSRLLGLCRSGGQRLRLRGVARRRVGTREPQDARVPQYQAPAPLRRREAEFQLEFACSFKSQRTGHALCWRPIPLPLPQTRPDVGSHFSRPHH